MNIFTYRYVLSPSLWHFLLYVVFNLFVYLFSHLFKDSNTQ